MQKNYSTTVEGMTCGNCALTISKMLEKKGAQNISANAASGEVHFSVKEDEDVTKVYDAIDSLGYHVVREGEGHEGNDHHGHDHGNDSTKLLLICAALTVPLLAHMFLSWPLLHNPLFQFILATPVFAIGCWMFAKSAWRSLLHGMPNMNVLIMIGATAAYVYSIIGWVFYSAHAHNYIFFETAASIITLVMTGNWLEERTVKSTTVAIDALAKLQPSMARIVMTDSIGKETVMEIESKFVKTGDVVLVNNGDSVPIDGEIIFGGGYVDERMITGESLPVEKGIGDKVIGGTLLAEGNMRVKAVTVGSGSVLNNIIRMVRDAQAVKPRLQKLADKISAIFVPVVLGIAVLTFLINYFFVVDTLSAAMMRSIAVLVISCPCAMGLATPAAVAVGLGRAARNGILVKGGDTLEQLKTVKQIVFDKTGTLTTGELKIENYQTNEIDEAEFKSVVASLEKHSTHPIARSVAKQWGSATQVNFAKIEEIKGRGIEAVDEDGDLWQLGSANWLAGKMKSKNFDLYLFKNKQYKGGLTISDTIRPDAKETVIRLHDMGYKIILLSGDRKEKCAQIAAELDIDQVFAEQSPEQKNNKLVELLKDAPTAMVGDGINDAPALAKATVGISLSDATHIAIQSANIILSNNKLSTLPTALKLGIYTEQTIKQNLFWAFLYNVVAIPVAAAGYLSPTWGAGIMALSDVVLIVNSLRLGIRKL